MSTRSPIHVTVEIGPDGKPRAAEAQARLSASATRLWSVIAGVERYPGRLPMIHRVRLTGDRVTVQLRFKLPLFSARFQFVADVHADPERSLELCWVSGEPRALHLRFDLSPDGPESCLVRARAALEVTSLGWLATAFLRHHPEIAFGVTPGVALNLLDSMRIAAGAEFVAPPA